MTTRTVLCATFAVDPVEPATQPLAVLPALQAMAKAVGKPEACGRPRESYVDGVSIHPLVAAVHLAFSGHRPLVFTPDVLWLTIVQGVAQHVALDPEKWRSVLVPHAGKATIRIVVDDRDYRTREDLWDQLTDVFRDQLQKTSLVSDRLTADFSTTGPIERVAQSVVLMDVLAPYYLYEMQCVCGIPEIRLAGTPEDWELLCRKVEELPAMDLDWWLNAVKSICREFAEAARSRVNLEHWQKIYKIRPGTSPYDPETSTGWLLKLFPYLVVQGKPSERNPLLEDESEGIGTGAIPNGLSRVPVTWRDLLRTGTLGLYAGVAGVTQDGIALTPAINWAVAPWEPSEAEAREVEQQRFGSTLASAAQQGDLASLDRILRERPDSLNERVPLTFCPNSRRKDKEELCEAAALHCAAAWGRLDAAAALLKAGASVNLKSVPGGLTPLHVAAALADVEMTRLLIAAGADVDLKDSKWDRPLLYVVGEERHFPFAGDWASHAIVEPPPLRGGEKERRAIVRLLIDAGAKRGVDEPSYGRLLDHATPPVVKILLEAEGASAGPVPDCYFQLAVQNLNSALIDRLLSRKPARESVQLAYESLAARKDPRRVEIARRLLAAGADPSAALLKGGTAETVAFLLDAGAPVDHCGHDKTTPLFTASLRGHEKLVRLLLERGASVHSRDSLGQTPLHAAIQERHLKCAELLLNAGADPHVRRSSPFGQETPMELAQSLGLHNLALKMMKIPAS